MGLERFVKAQEEFFDLALKEIKNGLKETHWIWFIFPQFAGMGFSRESYEYGLVSKKEAIEYYNNDYLRNNLLEISKALLNNQNKSLEEMVGELDAYKIRSCMTLFYKATGDETFKLVLDKYLNGIFDPITLKLLEIYDEKEINSIDDYGYVHKITEDYYSNK